MTCGLGETKGWGFKVEEDRRHCISNLGSFDDVLLSSSALNRLKKMMTDFIRCTEIVRLKIHPDKTHIFSPTNRTNTTSSWRFYTQTGRRSIAGDSIC